jgi:hypothetical protein
MNHYNENAFYPDSIIGLKHRGCMPMPGLILEAKTITMLSNTGTVSFILYGIFILIAIVGLFLIINAIKKGAIPADKLDKIIDLSNTPLYLLRSPRSH